MRIIDKLREHYYNKFGNLKLLRELKHFYYKKFVEAELSRQEINHFFKSFKNTSIEGLDNYLYASSWRLPCLLLSDNYKVEYLKTRYLEELLTLKRTKFYCGYCRKSKDFK